MKRVTTLLLLILANSLFGNDTAEKRPPNFLFFLSDDQLKADYGCYGSTQVHTPTIDAIAKEGLLFNKAFTAEAICAPSRSVLFSSLYPIKNGCFINHTESRKGIKTAFDYLTPLGYEVVLAGKVHVKPKEVYRWSTRWKEVRIKGKRRPVIPMKEIDNYLANVGEQKFCLFVTSELPHGPYPKKPEYDPKAVQLHPYQKDGEKIRQSIAGYFDHIKEKDQEVANVLTSLKKHGHEENTVFIYASDHGNGIGAKFTVYDRGLNIPFIVKWPGVIKPNTKTDALISFVDVIPTFVDIAGGGKLAGVDGKSFLPVLKNETSVHNDYVYGLMTNQGIWQCHIFPQRSIRGPKWHYIRNFNSEERVAWEEATGKEVNPFMKIALKRHKGQPEEELYDTENDPWELNNLASNPEYAEIKQQMKKQLFIWMEGQNDFLTENGDIPLLKTKHPLDENSKLNKVPSHLLGTITNYVDPHEITAQ